MARITEALTALDEEISMLIPEDQDAIAGIQYGSGGLGTLVLEGTCDDVTYHAIGIYPADGSAVVADLAAAGIAYARVGFVKRVRIRKSVAGAGPVSATLIVNYL